MRDGELDVQVDQRLERLGRLLVRGARASGAIQHPRHDAVAERLQQRLLAGEVPVHTGTADARRRTDVVDADVVVAAGREQRRGGAQQLLAARGGDGHRPDVSVRSHG
jgi:hypothetical protein